MNAYYVPSAPLSESVALFWLYDSYAPPHAAERLLPTGTTEMVIELDSGAIHVDGARSRYFVLDTSRPRALLGVHFRPGGAFPFLGLPAGELQNRSASLETLWGPAAEELRDRVLEVTRADDRFRILEEAMLARLPQSRARHPAVAFALKQFRRRPQSGDSLSPPPVSEVTRRIALSPRRFIELFRDEVGLTPKLYCRVRRFQGALRRITTEERVDWLDLALDCGYYDQAHFIHDFRAFSGLTPTAYLARRAAMRHPNHVPHEGLRKDEG